MTDPQDTCAACGHARHLHHPDTCVFARDVPGEFCRCDGFVEPRAIFTCPRCGAVSHNPNDVAESFCGRCGHYADAATEALVRSPRRTLGRTTAGLRAPPRVPPLTPERVAEIKAEIAEMRAVQTRIYHVGLKMPHGEWQAFAALVSVFASMCEIVLEQGYDYPFEAELAVIPEFKGKYLGEKFHRVFGPFLTHPAVAAAFLDAAGLKR